MTVIKWSLSLDKARAASCLLVKRSLKLIDGSLERMMMILMMMMMMMMTMMIYIL